MRFFGYTRARLQLYALVALLAALTVNCSDGDSPIEPDLSGQVPESAGAGSGTLRVIAEVQARDAGTSGFETDFLATVTDTSGAPVAGAVVTVSGGFGAVRLAEGVPGSYSAYQSGYETGSYTLNVTTDSDTVSGVTIDAPSVHVITKPVPGDTVTAGLAINVRWTRGAVSDECRLETRDYDSSWIYGDTGTLWAPGIGNPARVDQRIRVKRRNFVIPAGALPGSHFSVRLRRSVEPVVSL